MTETIRIVFPLFPLVTQLDFTGPHQVFSRLPGAKVITAAMGGQDIAADGLAFTGLADLAAVEGCEILCVPGGYGASDAILDEAYMREVRRLAAGARYVTSVCTGSLILGAAGLLQGKRAACHWAWRDLLAPFGAISDDARVVRDGTTFTGGGVTAGIDLGLAIAAEVWSPDVAQEVQLSLEYAPAPPFDAGRPETAPPHILDAAKARMGPLIAKRADDVAKAAARMAAAAP